MEYRRAAGDDVEKAQAAQNLHETQGQSARLHSTCCAAFLRMHSRKFRKHSPSPFERIILTKQCDSIHRTIKDDFKHAIVYGRSVKHQPQRVGLSHELADEDIGNYTNRKTNMNFEADQL